MTGNTPKKAKQVRKVGPQKLFVILDASKLQEGVKGQDVVKDIVRNPNAMFDMITDNPGLVFARITVKPRGTVAA